MLIVFKWETCLLQLFTEAIDEVRLPCLKGGAERSEAEGFKTQRFLKTSSFESPSHQCAHWCQQAWNVARFPRVAMPPLGKGASKPLSGENPKRGRSPSLCRFKIGWFSGGEEIEIFPS